MGVCRDLLFLQLPKTSLSASSPVHYICHPPVWDGLLLSFVSLCPLCMGGQFTNQRPAQIKGVQINSISCWKNETKAGLLGERDVCGHL